MGDLGAIGGIEVEISGMVGGAGAEGKDRKTIEFARSTIDESVIRNNIIALLENICRVHFFALQTKKVLTILSWVQNDRTKVAPKDHRHGRPAPH
ncbi:hypothetical protein KR51_00002750 [Rubidibacter lacunae KORDI 51-2]|uniref:Uncharacterized protein n=1 Tax=Rubidibacter lacunae KORDI 51-2 TaxID=582515 RepID=U5DEP2_9CHRO|nr:hypothetical protein [Rubidibacter lacunae]ERN42968.1 hypothetical protein KR51_00002750 [Rubidibacter lacunae KORDI 51-2]